MRGFSRFGLASTTHSGKYEVAIPTGGPPLACRLQSRMTTSSPGSMPSYSATSSLAGPLLTVVTVGGWRPVLASIV
jgi:hypothetical protein